ncbi:hypothetical protein EIP91_012281 [Steccherinum ochraceum]|uniref:Uncharacterized protein n=1 Tax=Steccherinum ochraceum TaxID=92696 RepID=A0A4V2MWU0_9APHY|nr:hypothetical protein EIP91_012281 [Steccherinum ochraceum]
MRTPVIAISLLGAAVFSPTFAAPAGTQTHSTHRQLQSGKSDGLAGTEILASRSLAGLGFKELLSRDRSSSQKDSGNWSIVPREFWKKGDATKSLKKRNLKKRLGDERTMGGNAHSGSSGAVNGGSVYNTDSTNNEGMPVLMNMNSNNAGLGGESTTGCANSGKGSVRGVGGNASSGNSGSAMGGSVNGPPSGMFNMNSNNAGQAGESATGCATGGDTVETEEENGLPGADIFSDPALAGSAVPAEETRFEEEQVEEDPFSNAK